VKQADNLRPTRQWRDCQPLTVEVRGGAAAACLVSKIGPNDFAAARKFGTAILWGDIGRSTAARLQPEVAEIDKRCLFGNVLGSPQGAWEPRRLY